MEKIELVTIDMTNIDQYGFYCTSNPKYDGYHAKLKWFEENLKYGLKLKQLKIGNRTAGFIEYIPGEYSWRAINAPEYLVIHCLMVLSKEDRSNGFASRLIQSCIDDAKEQDKNGVAVLTSDGAWMADKRVFLKNGFEEIGKKDRYELLVFNHKQSKLPTFCDWEKQSSRFKGWNLLIAHQCPMQYRCIADLKGIAEESGFKLEVTEYESAKEAQNAASGFAIFNLLKDSQLLADHYISKTRFKNILKKQ